VPEPIILPTSFNDDDTVVALFNIVVPETNNDDLMMMPKIAGLQYYSVLNIILLKLYNFL
jgi:hypothetical protein